MSMAYSKIFLVFFGRRNFGFFFFTRIIGNIVQLSFPLFANHHVGGNEYKTGNIARKNNSVNPIGRICHYDQHWQVLPNQLFTLCRRGITGIILKGHSRIPRKAFLCSQKFNRSFLGHISRTILTLL